MGSTSLGPDRANTLMSSTSPKPASYPSAHSPGAVSTTGGGVKSKVKDLIKKMTKMTVGDKKKPVAKKPVKKTTVAKKPAAKKPVKKTTVAKKPVKKTATTKKPVKKTTTKK